MPKFQPGDIVRYTGTPYPGMPETWTVEYEEGSRVWFTTERWIYSDKLILVKPKYTKEERVINKIKEMSERHKNFLTKKYA